MDGWHLTQTGLCEADGPRLVATYEISSEIPLAEAASALAIEQSLGTSSAPEPIVDRFGARVDQVADGKASISFPISSVASLPSLLVAVAGEAFETRTFDSLRLTGLSLPTEWLESFDGPGFGVEGVRRILSVDARPLVVAILKPSVGLTAGDAAELAGALALGGVDIIKDDELSAASPETLERAAAVSEALSWVEAETMRPRAYAVNLTGPTDQIAESADAVAPLGNVWPMLCEEAVGLDVLRLVRATTSRPILCHRAYAGASTRGRDFSIAASVLAGLTRIAGGDLVHCGGVGGKLFDTDEAVLENINSCRLDLAGMAPSLAIIGGGYWAGSVSAVRSKVGHDDFAFVFGSGITDHPDGPLEGAKSVMIALEADLDGESFASIAGVDCVERALERFGRPWE